MEGAHAVKLLPGRDRDALCAPTIVMRRAGGVILRDRARVY